MEEKVLTQEEMQNLKFRSGIVQSKRLELQLIERESQIFQRDLLKKYGIDPSKKFEIDARGVIKEIVDANNKGTDNVQEGAKPS